MSISERKQNFEIEESIDYETLRVDFDPAYFRRSALREIIRYQIFSDQPKTFIIVGKNFTTFISSNSLRDARRHKGNERREFLDLLAEEMFEAERVVLQIPRATEKF